ncbi:hypothetical protein [Dapis sp. BLCC M229]|uniref:hypothetical protein n=1 Tax=Dapis sp. BLCC M229 TaxID=3400188 RepID=UPI003CF6AB73
MIDATIVRAHTRSARAKNCSAEQEDIGRSKGRAVSKYCRLRMRGRTGVMGRVEQ